MEGLEQRQRPILVVDDDDIILSTVSYILTEEGYPVVAATNGQEALARAREHHPRLILLDMKMPVMDGWAFAAAYRAQTGPHAPIVVMTASQDSRSRAAEINADDFLAKPFDLENLLKLVQHYSQHE